MNFGTAISVRLTDCIVTNRCDYTDSLNEISNRTFRKGEKFNDIAFDLLCNAKGKNHNTKPQTDV